MGLRDEVLGLFAGSVNGLTGIRAGAAGRRFAKSTEVRVLSIVLLTRLMFITGSTRSEEPRRQFIPMLFMYPLPTSSTTNVMSLRSKDSAPAIEKMIRFDSRAH